MNQKEQEGKEAETERVDPEKDIKDDKCSRAKNFDATVFATMSLLKDIEAEIARIESTGVQDKVFEKSEIITLDTITENNDIVSEEMALRLNVLSIIPEPGNSNKINEKNEEPDRALENITQENYCDEEKMGKVLKDTAEDKFTLSNKVSEKLTSKVEEISAELSIPMMVSTDSTGKNLFVEFKTQDIAKENSAVESPNKEKVDKIRNGSKLEAKDLPFEEFPQEDTIRMSLTPGKNDSNLKSQKKSKKKNKKKNNNPMNLIAGPSIDKNGEKDNNVIEKGIKSIVSPIEKADIDEPQFKEAVFKKTTQKISKDMMNRNMNVENVMSTMPESCMAETQLNNNSDVEADIVNVIEKTVSISLDSLIKNCTLEIGIVIKKKKNVTLNNEITEPEQTTIEIGGIALDHATQENNNISTDPEVIVQDSIKKISTDKAKPQSKNKESFKSIDVPVIKCGIQETHPIKEENIKEDSDLYVKEDSSTDSTVNQVVKSNVGVNEDTKLQLVSKDDSGLEKNANPEFVVLEESIPNLVIKENSHKNDTEKEVSFPEIHVIEDSNPELQVKKEANSEFVIVKNKKKKNKNKSKGFDNDLTQNVKNNNSVEKLQQAEIDKITVPPQEKVEDTSELRNICFKNNVMTYVPESEIFKALDELSIDEDIFGGTSSQENNNENKTDTDLENNPDANITYESLQNIKKVFFNIERFKDAQTQTDMMDINYLRQLIQIIEANNENQKKEEKNFANVNNDQKQNNTGLEVTHVTSNTKDKDEKVEKKLYVSPQDTSTSNSGIAENALIENTKINLEIPAIKYVIKKGQAEDCNGIKTEHTLTKSQRKKLKKKKMKSLKELTKNENNNKAVGNDNVLPQSQPDQIVGKWIVGNIKEVDVATTQSNDSDVESQTKDMFSQIIEVTAACGAMSLQNKEQNEEVSPLDKKDDAKEIDSKTKETNLNNEP